MENKTVIEKIVKSFCLYFNLVSGKLNKDCYL